MEPTKKKKPSRFISVRLPAMLKRSERRESGSLSAHAQLCSRELPKVESDVQGYSQRKQTYLNKVLTVQYRLSYY